ncbi:Trk system potassium transporter TrkA [Streptococcus sp. E17BB]|uniref:Trk system potassium transporter TrkA n=1 Tax=Streptococcus sp. E17BB TaxID=3278714 RepID=UPI00359EFA2F
MKIIIVGGGKVGTALCRSLIDEDHDVTLIDEDEQVIKTVTKRHDLMGIVGNGVNFQILDEADVRHCDIFIALTDKDEVNMIAAVLAKKMGAKETIVRVRNPEYSNPYFRDHNILGFSQIINPELLTARYIANAIEFPNALSVEHFFNGRIMLMEFKIAENSRLVGLSLQQFRKKFEDILICAIVRGKEVIIPDGLVSIQANDKIFVTGQRQAMVNFHNSIKTQIIKNFMVIGAGKIAYYLMTILKNTKINVKLIELKRDRAEFFSETFSHLHVVKGNGTAKNVLLEEGVEHYDAVATLTGVDEENIIASMYLDSLGIPKNITKINRTSLLEIIGDRDFSSIVTPKLIAVDSMMHFIRGRKNAQESSLEALHHVAKGKVETLQFDITDHNKATDKPLDSLRLKPNIVIMAIIRKGKAIFPTGQDCFQINDKVIVATLQKNIHNICDLLD